MLLSALKAPSPSALPSPLGSGPATASEPAIDRTYLARFTLGNTALEREVLELFASQAPQYLERLGSAVSACDFAEAAHALKGSAAAVGARPLARLAERAQRLDPNLAPPEREAQRAWVMGLLAEATTAACRQIDQMFKPCG
jgi:HPt (histidine-containing phosphotransfer) domain-containing protein